MNQYETSDLALAAYLTFKGLKLISAKKLASGRFQFVIADDKGEADALSLEYFSSDFCMSNVIIMPKMKSAHYTCEGVPQRGMRVLFVRALIFDAVYYWCFPLNKRKRSNIDK